MATERAGIRDGDFDVDRPGRAPDDPDWPELLEQVIIVVLPASISAVKVRIPRATRAR